MKKKFFIFCLTILLQISLGEISIVSAEHTLPKDELVIGGIGYGGTLGYVKEIYGEPDEIRTIQKKGIKEVLYIYSKNFKISGKAQVELNLNEADYPVDGFFISTNSMQSDSGIRVGTPFKTIEDKYGAGKKYETPDKELFYRYEFDGGKTNINYVVNEKGLISKIYMSTEV